MLTKCPRMSANEPWVAVVTGGAAGIGEATSRKLASRGINILVADVQDELGQQLVSELKSTFQVDAFYLHVDVSLENDVQAMIETAVKRWGRLDYAANVAGICRESQFDESDVTVETFDKSVPNELHLLGMQ